MKAPATALSLLAITFLGASCQSLPEGTHFDYDTNASMTIAEAAVPDSKTAQERVVEELRTYKNGLFRESTLTEKRRLVVKRPSDDTFADRGDVVWWYELHNSNDVHWLGAFVNAYNGKVQFIYPEN